LDQYRIVALEKMLTASLSWQQQQAVLQQLVHKCHIVALGAQKRHQMARCALYQGKEHCYRQRLVELGSEGG
jgi:hypothetical protein